jgi:hypothetical protein
VKERYILMRQGKWSPAYRKTNTNQLEHYLIAKFGDLALRKLDSFQIQKQKFLAEDPGEDVKMPQTKVVDKSVMTQEQIPGLVSASRTCTIFVCFRWESSVVSRERGHRLQWKSWTGEALVPYGTAYEGQFFTGRSNTKQSKSPIPLPSKSRLTSKPGGGCRRTPRRRP